MYKIPLNMRILGVILSLVLVLDGALAVLLLAGPGHGACSGIQGMITREAAAEPRHEAACGGYGEYVVVVRDAVTNRIVIEVTPDEEGYFHVRLIPGKYLLDVQSPREDALLSGCVEAAVKDGEITSVTVQLARRRYENALPVSGKAA